MTTPFVHPVNVTWGDCDPARIAYTARMPYFALDAINGWWEAHLDGDGWFQMEIDRNVGTPFVKLEMEFHSPVTPRHTLLCETYPVRLGNKSITFAVKGRQNDVLCFDGLFTCVFIIADQFKSQNVPAELRAMIEPLLREA
ncbi:Thioesterase superfamily protein [Sulfitobacter noctilucicola]|uniref:Acyl-CoA thioesterase FadM n=1 Tax=Sulfitobacter noctilucicola TaxID=1342301 RepID=A0A7W6M647_9RHOB|nr:thioesterase family protein [Sulfitobacter noctilucicola]KIN62370.1 Thioesterase superfamily protein [Sulfitobacter noctilucicola]MBB4173096.1 acyl-CoA thioesterase FadM [Sulfitobacter noctilucicola]